MFRIMLAAVVLSLGSGASAFSVSATQGGAVSPTELGTVNRQPEPDTPRVVALNIDRESNPLAKVALEVSTRLGIPVAYEEPAWIAATDLIPLSESPEFRRTRSAVTVATVDPRQRAAALGSVAVERTLHYRQDEFEFAGDLLQSSLDDHHRRGNPGLFKLVRFGDFGYSIVPTNVRDENGDWLKTESPLDARISFPEKHRSLGQTLQLIAQAIKDSTGHQLRADTALPGVNGIYSTRTMSVGASNELARDVLVRTYRQVYEQM